MSIAAGKMNRRIKAGDFQIRGFVMVIFTDRCKVFISITKPLWSVAKLLQKNVGAEIFALNALSTGLDGTKFASALT